MTAGRTRVGWAVLAALLVVQCAFVLSQLGQRTTEPHEVGVAVQGPDVVAQGIVARVNRLAGHPVVATALPGDADPRAVVRDGPSVGVMVVDVTGPHDVLYVSTVADPDLNVILRQLAGRVSAPLDRPFETRAVAPRHHPEVSRTTLQLAVGGWLVAGFLLAIGLSFVRARVGRGRWAVLLVGACAAFSLVVAVLAATRGCSFLTSWLLGFGATLTAAAATAALDALFGLVGVAVASTLFVFATAPLFSGRDPQLLPSPWREVAPWTPHGATFDLATSLTWFGAVDVVRPLLVLGGCLLVALVAWAAASRPVTTPKAGSTRWLRAAAWVVPVVLAVVAAVLLAPSGTTIVSATPVQGATETQCIPRQKISTLAELNHAVLTVRAGSSFQGADVGADVALQDGRRLWAFADTLRAPDFDGEKFVRNSMLVFDPSCVQTVLPADHGALIPDRGDGIGYWPMSIARVQRKGYDIVGVATQRVKTTNKPDGIFAFETLGPAMAVFVVPRGKPPQLLMNSDIGADKVDTTRPMWGAAAAVDGDWVYLYGTARPAGKGIFGFSLQVARTKVADLVHSDRWQYWDGRSWQAKPSRAKVLIPADGGVSQTLSVFQRGGRWYAVSKRNEVLGTDLVVWTAPSPTGPWDRGTKVADLPSDPTTGELRYMPLAHPDLLREAGSVLVSYSRNNTDAAKVNGDPFLYRPLFVKVTLPR